jgi:hypothetical protein
MKPARAIVLIVPCIILSVACSDNAVTPPTSREGSQRQTSRYSVVNVSNTQQLRAALAGAASYTTIQMAAGTFEIGSDPVRIENVSNIEVMGAGRGQTIVHADADAPAIFYMAGTVYGLSMAHMNIRGTAHSSDPITEAITSGDDRVGFRNQNFFDLDISDVNVGMSLVEPRSAECYDMSVTDNVFHNIPDRVSANGATSGSGYGIDIQNCKRVVVRRNVFVDTERHAIYQSLWNTRGGADVGGIVIDDNLIVNHAQKASIDEWYLVALSVARSSNVVVSNNVIVAPRYVAMDLDAHEENTSLPTDNIQFINNTILGAGGYYDLSNSAAGSFITWGNKFAHFDLEGAGNSPRITRYGALGNQGNFVEPSAFAGTSAMAEDHGTGHLIVVQGGTIYDLTPSYPDDPAVWNRRTSPEGLGDGVTGIAVSGGHAYILAGGRIHDIDLSTWRVITMDGNYGGQSQVAGDEDGVVVATGAVLHRLIPGFGGVDNVTTLPAGILSGLAVYEGKAYALAGNCFYSVGVRSGTVTKMGCPPFSR